MRLSRHFIAAAFAMSVLHIPGVAAQEPEPGPPDVSAHLQNVIDARVAERMRADINGTARHRNERRVARGLVAPERVYVPVHSTGPHVRYYRIPAL